MSGPDKEAGRHRGSGAFSLYARREGKEWGLIERKPYDSAQRRRAEWREAIYDEIVLCWANWQANYDQFRHADFCIEEQDGAYGLSRHIMGIRRARQKVKRLAVLSEADKKKAKGGGYKRTPLKEKYRE